MIRLISTLNSSVVVFLFSCTYSLALPTDPVEFNSTIISSTSSIIIRPHSSLALDSSDSPHIIFQKNREAFQSTGDIFYAFKNGNAWEVETVASCFRCDVTPDIAIDTDGKLHIAYIDAGMVQYGVHENGTWQIEPVSNPVTITPNVVALASDSLGVPHLVFNDNGTSGYGSHYATLNGNTWDVEIVGQWDRSPLHSNFLAFDIELTSQDIPVIAGRLSNPGTLQIATREASSWTLENIGTGGVGASLALDASDTVHVGHAVRSDDDLRYSTKSNGVWTNEIVQNLGPGAAGPSLALGPNGLPRMVFSENFGGNDDQLLHSYYNGQDWITGPIEANLTVEPITSLAVSQDGTSHVAYSFRRNVRYATGVIVPEPTIPALVDIKPGGSANPVNPKSKGVLSVAILGTDEFDVNDVDIDTLLFGDPLLIDNGGTAVSPLRNAYRDVSGDGLLDLTLKFSTADLVEHGALGFDTVEGLLTGELLDGTPFEGLDSIRIVPPNRSNGNSLQVSAVPEPTTSALALAALCLATSRRRSF